MSDWRIKSKAEWFEYIKECDPYEEVPVRFMVGKLMFTYDLDEKKAISHCEEEHKLDFALIGDPDNISTYWLNVKNEILSFMIYDLLSHP